MFKNKKQYVHLEGEKVANLHQKGQRYIPQKQVVQFGGKHQKRFRILGEGVNLKTWLGKRIENDGFIGVVVTTILSILGLTVTLLINIFRKDSNGQLTNGL